MRNTKYWVHYWENQDDFQGLNGRFEMVSLLSVGSNNRLKDVYKMIMLTIDADPLKFALKQDRWNDMKIVRMDGRCNILSKTYTCEQVMKKFGYPKRVK